MGWVLSRASAASAAFLPHWKSFQISYEGSSVLTAFVDTHSAKASLSHRSSHHFIVTRLPNHMWANSCATTWAMLFSACHEAVLGSMIRADWRKITRPLFSIAPAAKPGTAAWSYLSK